MSKYIITADKNNKSVINGDHKNDANNEINLTEEPKQAATGKKTETT
jgi:hypothetical protein